MVGSNGGEEPFCCYITCLKSSNRKPTHTSRLIWQTFEIAKIKTIRIFVLFFASVFALLGILGTLNQYGVTILSVHPILLGLITFLLSLMCA